MAAPNKEPTTQKDTISMRRDGTKEMNVSMGRFILISRPCKVNIIFLKNNINGLQKISQMSKDFRVYRLCKIIDPSKDLRFTR
jgi:hypothetical protein